MNATMHNNHPTTIHTAVAAAVTTGYLPIPASEATVETVPTSSLFFANGIISLIGDMQGYPTPISHAEFQTWEGIINHSSELQEVVVNALLNPDMIAHPQDALADLYTGMINLSSPDHTPMPVQLIGYPIQNTGLENTWITG